MSNDLENFWSSDNNSLPSRGQNTQPPEPERPSLAAREELAEDILFTETSIDKENSIDDLLRIMISKGASDLHLSASLPPMIRVNGDMEKLEGQPKLTGAMIDTMIRAIMKDVQERQFDKTHELDFAHSIPGLSRFRVNVLRQREKTGVVIRAIPNKIKSADELGLPEELNKLAFLPRGLVLVTGPTGSGKSTTLAAIIDRANRSRKDHIITIEDPIEFNHENQNCIVTQREIGVDTESFANALKASLREDPDIILVGEMRDLETIQTAITAAETGHLVFGTLHTQSAAETISRIIDVFPEGSKEQVRQQLGSTIQGIVCQTLVKTIDGKRTAALEFMKGTSAIRNLIRKNNIAAIESYIETGKKDGMQTLDTSLTKLVKDGKVKIDIAAEKSKNSEEFYKAFGTEEQIAAIRRKEDQRTNNPFG